MVVKMVLLNVKPQGWVILSFDYHKTRIMVLIVEVCLRVSGNEDHINGSIIIWRNSRQGLKVEDYGKLEDLAQVMFYLFL